MKNVLIVDDSPTIRQQVSVALRQAGFTTIEATDGIDALTKVDSSVAMMVCDVNMPRMNGLELLEKLGASPEPAPPTVMLTTEGNRAHIDRAKKTGVKGWIIKPFKADLLVAAVQKLAR